MTLEIITSGSLGPVKHGFFTRKGGASSGVYESLNCGHGSSDQRDTVILNRRRVADALKADAMAFVHQAHTARAIPIDGPLEKAPKADGMATAMSGVILSVLTADCQPVLFADRQANVIGAAHAGWRGALDGVLEATVHEMESLGADRARISAVIGPSISQAAYEVGPEFLDRFVSDDPDNQRFFAKGEGDRHQFDLTGYGLKRLRDTGVGSAEWTGHSTYSDPARFYSQRRSLHRNEPDYGRLISSIRL